MKVALLYRKAMECQKSPTYIRKTSFKSIFNLQLLSHHAYLTACLVYMKVNKENNSKEPFFRKQSLSTDIERQKRSESNSNTIF